MNILNARLQQKHDIAANWEKSKLIPLAGEIIVYDDRYIDSNNNEVIVATATRYKIGDGVTPVNKLPFADAADLTSKVKELIGRVNELATNDYAELVPVDGTISIIATAEGPKEISVAISPNENNALIAVESGLFVPQHTAGDGIKIVDNEISVKLADITHGLTAVNGALTLNLATKSSDGAMSKEDKALLEALPELYEARRYEIAHKPEGTVVDYREKEIRVMCPVDTEWTQQNSGEGADKDRYYIGLKAYAPKDAVSFKEDLAEVISDTNMYYFENNEFAGIDEYNRRYSIVWLPVAKLVDDSWNYYGSKSTEQKYIGWYYSVEWYSKSGELIDTETIRINLSNEACHNNINSFYGSENDVATKVTELEDTINKFQEDSCWGTF